MGGREGDKVSNRELCRGCGQGESINTIERCGDGVCVRLYVCFVRINVWVIQGEPICTVWMALLFMPFFLRLLLIAPWCDERLVSGNWGLLDSWWKNKTFGWFMATIAIEGYFLVNGWNEIFNSCEICHFWINFAFLWVIYDGSMIPANFTVGTSWSSNMWSYRRNK